MHNNHTKVKNIEKYALSFIIICIHCGINHQMKSEPQIPISATQTSTCKNTIHRLQWNQFFPSDATIFWPCLGGRTLIKEKFLSVFVCGVYGVRPATPHITKYILIFHKTFYKIWNAQYGYLKLLGTSSLDAYGAFFEHLHQPAQMKYLFENSILAHFLDRLGKPHWWRWWWWWWWWQWWLNFCTHSSEYPQSFH